MKDPARIEPTLEAVKECWKKYPDMRLGQLLWGLAGCDPFLIEDDALIEAANEAAADDIS